ncbi:hypothetical protein LTR37_000322 [Vermiconidia calcicola]|uniref:Uncharacterized protein n=1 Tax=Vermiconidia calcicola TaxID=1690605 RepID=A0ACC3NZ42_9PEZI|nr:hypothetical protein LTR37_000322 [Vermiconidia calcicola]
MLAFKTGNVSQATQVRNFVLGGAIVITLFFLLQSFDVGPHEIHRTTRSSLQAISKLRPGAWQTHGRRITKVTSLFGQENELYEAAIRSHEEHNDMHGYDTQVLREKIVDNYWSKPTYLLSLLVTEMAKPVEERTEWLMWFGPDVILLNPQIPLEIFLPPSDFINTHFLGTHDQEGINCGVFFLRVHEWSVRMMIEVLTVLKSHIDVKENPESQVQKALQTVITSDQFRGHVNYQPRTWYNAYQLGMDEFEGEPGNLLVHFHDLGGDKWSAMANTIDQKEDWRGRLSVPLKQTTYELETREYWERIRRAWHLLNLAQSRPYVPDADESFRRLQYAVTYEMDRSEVLITAMGNLQDALGLQENEKVV